MKRASWVFVWALSCTLGCGGTSVGGDAGPGDAEVDCAMAAEGRACGAGSICVAGACVASACGDGIVDPASGEECDDANMLAFDGCTACRLDCTADSQCDDEDSCTGIEQCSTATHGCTAGTFMPAGSDCTSSRVIAGVCRDIAGHPTCVPPGCGNGVADGIEDCDDGANGNPDDGCRDDCTFTCASDDDCDDRSVCNGMEVCDGTTHRCVAGAMLDCDDGDACTADACDAALGCAHPLIDADGDGHAPRTLGACGDDCNDTNDTVHAGAIEECDRVDNDCDGAIDETAPTWYVDCDRDGFAASGTGSIQACAPPVTTPTSCAGPGTWTSLEPASASTTDCDDDLLDVRPGAIEACNRRDDNCDGFVDENQLQFTRQPRPATRASLTEAGMRAIYSPAQRQIAIFNPTVTSPQFYRVAESGSLLGASALPNAGDAVLDDRNYLFATANVSGTVISMFRIDGSTGASTALGSTGLVLVPSNPIAARLGASEVAVVFNANAGLGFVRFTAATGVPVAGSYLSDFAPQIANVSYLNQQLVTTSSGVAMIATRRTITFPGFMMVDERILRTYDAATGLGPLVVIGPARTAADVAYEPQNDRIVVIEETPRPATAVYDVHLQTIAPATGVASAFTDIGTNSATRTFVGYAGEPGQIALLMRPSDGDPRFQYRRLRLSDLTDVPGNFRIDIGFEHFLVPASSGSTRAYLLSTPTDLELGLGECIP